MPKHILNFFLVILLLSFSQPGSAICQESPDPAAPFDSTEALIDILREKGILTEEEAERFIERYREKGEKEQPVVEIIPERERDELTREITRQITDDINKDIEQIKDEAEFRTDELLRKDRLNEQKIEALEKTVKDDHAQQLNKSSWAQRIRFGGDVRLRYESRFFPDDNAVFVDRNNPADVINNQVDTSEFRARVRIGVKVKIIDPRETNVGNLEAGIRLATGNIDNPVSTNETFGDFFNKDSVVFDQYYLKWSYIPELPVWGDMFPEFTIIGGRMPNPWFYTNLLWDHDLNFEGLAVNFKTDTLDSNPFTAFFTAGAFPLQNFDGLFANEDKWLYGAQLGFEHKPAFDLAYKIGFAYYDYTNIEGVLNETTTPGFTDWSSSLFQFGNTVFNINPFATTLSEIKYGLATDYNLVNLTGKLDFTRWYPNHIILVADYVRNVGFDENRVAQVKGVPNPPADTEGYQVGILYGIPKIIDFGEWNASLYYKYIEPDAVLDLFTDSDFHLGGTNAQGWILTGEYGLYRNLWLRARWITTDEVKGPKFSADTLQIDLNARY